MKSFNDIQKLAIRHATVADALAIATIHVKTWQFAYAHIFPAEFLAGLSIENRYKAWQRQLEEKHIIVLVAEVNNEVVGWASGGENADEDIDGASELQALYVLPDYWGTGLGSALSMAIEGLLTLSPEITLWVLLDNPRAIRFYEKIGYAADGTQSELERGGVKRWKIRLRKQLVLTAAS